MNATIRVTPLQTIVVLSFASAIPVGPVHAHDLIAGFFPDAPRLR